MNLKRILLLLVLLVSFLLSGTPLSLNAQGADYDIPNGHFYTQTANGEGGFSVLDNSQANFWSDFQRLGGLQTVGYPISRRYEKDGFVTQAFQKLVLQWRPEVGQAWPVNVFDELSKSGFDQTLLQTRQTPLPLDSQFDDPGASWPEIVAKRQGLLDENPAIRARYFSVSDPLNVFGLPTSELTDMGNHYAIRTQRAVFQQWKEDVPWAAQGDVTIANGGDIAKELGWLAENALLPHADPNATTQIRTLLVGPGSPSRLYALTDRTTLLVSDDLGNNWRPFAGDLPVAASCLHDVNMDYATVDALYASTCEGLYRWQDTTWRKISEQETFKVAIVYGQPEVIWAIAPLSNTPRTIIRSNDGGVTWDAANTGLPGGRGGPLDIAIDPTSPTTLYAIGIPEKGPYYLARGNNSGQWSVLPQSNQQFLIGSQLSIDGATGDLYVIDAPAHQLWRTQNPKEVDGNQIEWELAQDFNDVLVELLATGQSPDGLAIYVNLRPRPGDPATAMKSLNGGRTWSLITLP
ncbi:MAG: WD40/YVTN/BNR-like repeat-containing protein [Ardenticatenaceae bacterium]